MKSSYINKSICINITRRCNLSCPECYILEYINTQNNKNQIDLSLIDIKNIVQNLDFDTVYLTGGEPFCHPEIRDIINHFFYSNKKIQIATNGLLLNNDLINFISNKNIDLLISLRSEYKEIFKIVNKLKDYKIKVSCYHLPEKTSPELLYEFMNKCDFVNDYKLLYNSKNPPTPEKWFTELANIYLKIKNISQNKNINVELGFLPKNHIISKDQKRGGFNRIQINTEGDIYCCPLLAEKKEINVCSMDTCPILMKKIDDDCFTSICCFLVTSLENAIKVWLYGKKNSESNNKLCTGAKI